MFIYYISCRFECRSLDGYVSSSMETSKDTSLVLPYLMAE